jgi:RNA polymerase sigma-70 factor, ECF subfamily
MEWQGMKPDAGGPDEVWAQRATTDRDAFAELVQRHADRIYNLAYRMTGNQADAEDMVQETFIRAYRALPGFRIERSFGAWLYRIAVNVCLTHRGRQAGESCVSLHEDVPALFDGAASVSDLTERHEVQVAVQQAIAGLAPMYRAVVVLYHLEDRSYMEIADLLGLPLNTVRTHLHRGRAALRERLAATSKP